MDGTPWVPWIPLNSIDSMEFHRVQRVIWNYPEGHLVLSKNLLKDVPTRALKLLRNLDHLNLNDNKITALHENAFKGLSKVQIICKSFIENEKEKLRANCR